MSKKKVLVVDDEQGIVESIKYILELTDNYAVIEASNAEEAFEKYKTESPDLVITDIRMPNKDGLWLLDQIRENDSNTPIIMMSGYTSATKEEIDSRNYQSFLSKPNDIVNIVEVVDKFAS